MKWIYETEAQRITRLIEWHKWFAWKPVYVKGTAYWLTTIYRRGVIDMYCEIAYYEYLGELPVDKRTQFEKLMNEDE